jgi:hypothetical protein
VATTLEPVVDASRLAAMPAGRLGPRASSRSARGESPPAHLDPPRGETPSKELRHARHRRSCGGLSVIGVAGPSVGVYPFRCKCWRCSRCGPRKVNQTRRRIQAGLGRGDSWFATLTSPGDEDPEASLRLLSARWKAFHLRLTRLLGHVEYVAVVEIQRRGSPHFHVLVRGPLVSRRWLAKAAAGVGFGRMADVQMTPRGIAGYLTKAIGPNTSGDSLPTHFRRVRWSRGWSLPLPARAKRMWQAWYVAVAGTHRAAASAVELGYRVVELINGPPDPWPTTHPVRWLPLGAVFGR